MKDSDLRTGAFCKSTPGRYHEAEAVRQGYYADRAGGRNPDLPGVNTGMEEIIVGVVGVLQFDVLKFRLESEYNVEIRLEPLPYEHIRWIANKEEVDLTKLVGTSDMKKIKDLKGRPLLLFVHEWSIRMTLERNEGLRLSEFGRS